jgi:hypothetical protein
VLSGALLDAPGVEHAIAVAAKRKNDRRLGCLNGFLGTWEAPNRKQPLKRRQLGPSHNVACTRLEGDVIHDPNPSHPVSIMLCTHFAKLFGLPLGYGNRRGTVSPHEPVANEARLRSEDRDSLSVNLMKDALGFG